MNIILRPGHNVSRFRDATHDRDGQPFPELERRFSDDTGAAMMIIYNEDMRQLMGHDVDYSTWPTSHLMGFTSMGVADGNVSVIKIICVQANMTGKDEEGNPALVVDQWHCLPCIVLDDNKEKDMSRQNGPWLRKLFYVASAPEFPDLFLYAGTTRVDLMAPDVLLIVSETRRAPPCFSRPTEAVNWKLDPTT